MYKDLHLPALHNVTIRIVLSNDVMQGHIMMTKEPNKRAEKKSKKKMLKYTGAGEEYRNYT